LKDGAQADEAAIRCFCQGRIAHYKIPRYVRIVDTFPTTVTGKVQRFVLRAEAAAELGLAEEKTA
jgi:fatty-acyl-CoA synthase